MPRPKANIDWDFVGRLLEAGCDGVECAAHYGIDENTLYNRAKEDLNISFSDYLRQKRSKGDALLKAKQFEAAVNDKDKAMMIWLGKQRLGQRDKQDVKHEGNAVSITFELDERFKDTDDAGISAQP